MEKGEFTIAILAGAGTFENDGLPVVFDNVSNTGFFKIEGATVIFNVDYGSTLPADATYWKAGDPSWYQLDAVVIDTVIQISITDGGVDDDDGLANGKIVDPGGASIAAIFVDGFESE